MQTRHIHDAETCLRTSQGPITLVSHEANRNAALSPFEACARGRRSPLGEPPAVRQSLPGEPSGRTGENHEKGKEARQIQDFIETTS